MGWDGMGWDGMGWDGTSFEPSHNCVANVLMWVGFILSVFVQDTRISMVQRKRKIEGDARDCYKI
jgi:hypothetical protein